MQTKFTNIFLNMFAVYLLFQLSFLIGINWDIAPVFKKLIIGTGVAFGGFLGLFFKYRNNISKLSKGIYYLFISFQIIFYILVYGFNENTLAISILGILLIVNFGYINITFSKEIYTKISHENIKGINIKIIIPLIICTFITIAFIIFGATSNLSKIIIVLISIVYFIYYIRTAIYMNRKK